MSSARAAEVAARLEQALAVVDAAFGEAAAAAGPAVPCRRGCSACCVAVFDVHPGDALLLGRWLDEQPPATRADVLGRAEAVLRAARGSGPAGWSPEEGFATLDDAEVERLAEAVPLPCPILGAEGECRAHASRPAICRLQGLPWRDARTGTLVPDGCRLVPGQATLVPVPLDFDAVDEARLEARERLAGDSLPRGRTFVAEALVRWARAATQG